MQLRNHRLVLLPEAIITPLRLPHDCIDWTGSRVVCIIKNISCKCELQ
jgi:hypothetical protein